MGLGNQCFYVLQDLSLVGQLQKTLLAAGHLISRINTMPEVPMGVARRLT